jgi:hypothetical protein
MDGWPGAWAPPGLGVWALASAGAARLENSMIPAEKRRTDLPLLRAYEVS